jgi:hypothetical protein
MDDGKKKPEQEEPEGTWQYKSDTAAPETPPTAPVDKATSAPEAEVEWTASEFVAHHKGFLWYASFGLVGFVMATGVYVITHDLFSVFVIGTLAAVIGVAASRKPRVMTYRLNRAGLTIGQRFHPYGEFKSFSVIDEGAFASITFMPLKRFMPTVSIYFSPEDEKRIIEALSRHLPMQPAPRDTFDTILRRVRF